ncbi:MAG: hypothetical protein EBQ79_00155, partial [Actinobacteria bacterium]|nr:hypothetical protein [Actinomycetota bacterium]
VELSTGVTEVEVVAEATDPQATVEISGGSDLQPGDNELVVTVTAADGETTATYTVTLVVLLSAETGITSITVEGTEIQPGDIVTVAKDVTSVSVEVTAKDETAEVVVEGADALELGDNTITITVTAPNGDSETYEFTVRVGGASADTALTSLTLNGVEVTDGQIIELPARTTSVNVVAVPRDEAASIKVTGKTGLKVGTNLVEIEVTAPDQVAKKTYTLTVVVAPLSSNTNLSAFKVNGEDVIDGATVQLPALTRQVTVDAITADPEATVAITGRTNLADGTNTLSVAVTAADGTVRTYLVTLNVRILSGDKSLSVFKINGNTVQNRDVVNVANGTQSVEVEAVANSEVATLEIIGGTGLVTGDNFVSVLVRAENGSTQLYRVNVKVALSSVKTLSTFKVAGQDVVDGAELVLPQYTKFVTVQVATTDANARFTIQGATGLVSGNNQLAVVVTAADGTQATYTVKLYVTPLSSDTSLKAFKINGVDVVDQGTVTVPALTTSVPVVATTNDVRSAAVVSGRTGLVDGNNIVSVTVTAQDGTVKVYQVTVRVLIRSSDTSLQSISVNGSDYTGTPVNVAFGTSSVDVNAVPTSAVATVAIFGASGLRTGNNTVTIRVTAENQTFKLYTVTVVVAKSSNTALRSLTVNGAVPPVEGALVFPARTAFASVKAVAVDPDATIAVSGTALVAGE